MTRIDNPDGSYMLIYLDGDEAVITEYNTGGEMVRETWGRVTGASVTRAVSQTRQEIAVEAQEPGSGVYVLPEPERSKYLRTGEIDSEQALVTVVKGRRPSDGAG